MERFQSRKNYLKAMRYVAGAHREIVDALWEYPDGLVEAGNKLVEKQCVRTTVRFAIEDEMMVVKRHLERSWRHFAIQCFRKSRAERCWLDTWYLIDSGYPTPRPIAFRENRLGPLRGNSWYAYEFVSGQTFKDIATDNHNQRLLRQYVGKLIDIWDMNRQLKINLTDGHPANFVVDATGKMWVIDLDKLQHLGHGDDHDAILRNSFEQTIRGVIGDRHVIDYALKGLDCRFSSKLKTGLIAA
jgi:hypothetical protein